MLNKNVKYFGTNSGRPPIKDGRTTDARYNSYRGIIQRCYGPNHNRYKYYGGKGIGVCERWLKQPDGFVNFCKDMGRKPEGYSIDRIDPNKDYCPENCRWASSVEQNLNKSNARKEPYIYPTYSGTFQVKISRQNITILRKNCKTFDDAIRLRNLFLENLE